MSDENIYSLYYELIKEALYLKYNLSCCFPTPTLYTTSNRHNSGVVNNVPKSNKLAVYIYDTNKEYKYVIFY